MADQRWWSLSDAALQAGMNRERLLRLVQDRRVEGRRNLTGRWEVNGASLQRHLAASPSVLPQSGPATAVNSRDPRDDREGP